MAERRRSEITSIYPEIRRHARNLPRPMTSFIGREQEVAAVSSLLKQSHVRLVTLTGAGGSGKTRLALAVAAQLGSHFIDGVWFVSLATLADLDLVVPTIARSLDIREHDDTNSIDVLADELQNSKALIVLDNFEHLIGAVGVIPQLLESCPSLSLLVTSREPLHLTGEYGFPVPPLQMIDPNVDVQGDAVQLFIERARLVDPEFGLTDSNAPVIAEICRRLEGLPLAIELAAARTKLLSPSDLLARLDQPLDLLTGGPRDAPQRQQTMLATLQWSYDLLPAAEQQLFRQLAVFSGGWTLAAVEAVSLQPDVMEHLLRLVEKGLVQRRERQDRTTRYDMLEPVRQFAKELLDQHDEVIETRQRHADYYYTVIEGYFKRYDGPAGATELERIEADHDNLMAAIRWLSETNQTEQALRFIGEIGIFWFERGYFIEGWAIAEAVLNAPGASQPTYGRARAIWASTWLRLAHENSDVAFQLINESYNIMETLNDRDGMGHALFRRAALHYRRGEISQAWADLERCRSLFLELQDHAMLARVAHYRGFFFFHDNNLESARAALEDGLALAREHGLHATRVLILGVLISVARFSHHTQREAELLVERLTLLRSINIHWSIADAFEEVGSFARRSSFLEVACTLFASAKQLRVRDGGPHSHRSLTDIDEEVREIEDTLSPAEFDAAWNIGRELSVDEAIDLALQTIREIQSSMPPSALGRLSPREVEVMQLVVQGFANAQIGEALYISPRTAAQHLRSIYNKLGVNSRAAAVARWLEISST